MNRIGVVGISWRHHQVNLVGEVTIPREAREARLPRLAAETGATELVYLATCNRVEVVFATDGRTPFPAYRRRLFAALTGREPNDGEAEHTFRLWQGEGAIEHLFIVCSGLDSARIGEGEIATQFRDAVEQSKELGLVGARLGPVFEDAMRIAKRVRPVTERRVGLVSLAQIATWRAARWVEEHPGAVALVGVSPMTEQCGRDLRALGISVVVVNRTVERADGLASEIGAASRSLDAFRAEPDPVEALVLATGAQEPVLRRADLERIAARTPSGRAPLVIDLGVPPNVNPEDAAAAEVPRVGMAEITEEAAEHRGRLMMEFAEARAMLDDALTEVRRRAADRLVGPLITELRRRYDHTAEEGVERLFQRHLPGLSEAEREAVRRWAGTLSRRFAHIPTVGLRELAFQAGPAAVEAFFIGTSPALTRELRRSAEDAGLERIPELDS